MKTTSRIYHHHIIIVENVLWIKVRYVDVKVKRRKFLKKIKILEEHKKVEKSKKYECIRWDSKVKNLGSSMAIYRRRLTQVNDE